MIIFMIMRKDKKMNEKNFKENEIWKLKNIARMNLKPQKGTM